MLEEFLAAPTGQNLLSLGEDRAQLITNSLDRGSPDSPPPIQQAAALYSKITASYVDQCDATVKEAVETTLGNAHGKMLLTVLENSNPNEVAVFSIIIYNYTCIYII